MVKYNCEFIEGTRKLEGRELIRLSEFSGFKKTHMLDENEVYTLKGCYAFKVVTDDKEYYQYVIECEELIFTTGSNSLYEKLLYLFESLEGEDVTFNVISKESKNYKGKFFYTAILN